MQFSTFAIVSALTAAVSAHGNHSTTVSAVWVTDVVTSFTTVCPAATTISFNGVTYTATESETITITNCPCTISKPVYTTSSVICNTCTAIPGTAVPTTAPVYVNSTAPVYLNSTTPAPTSTATSKGVSVGTITPSVSSSAVSKPSASTTSPLTNTNNGNRFVALSGGSLAGLLGVAAYLL